MPIFVMQYLFNLLKHETWTTTPSQTIPIGEIGTDKEVELTNLKSLKLTPLVQNHERTIEKLNLITITIKTTE